jgi:hypothetical protein
VPIAAKDVMYRITTALLPIDCPICHYTTYGGSSAAFNDVCNHLLTEHKLPCLHVGQETDMDSDGKLHQSTAAIFGR